MSKKVKKLQLANVFGFRIGKVIGKGTYSKVCLATSDDCDKKLACKIISKKQSGKEFLKKFLPRELEIIKCINHPNIVKVYRIFETPLTVYVFMEYCELGDILEYIQNNGPFTEERTRLLFRQIVEAVHYLHNLNFAHRDIKCDNIFLWNNCMIKLGDFGFSRYCVNEHGEYTMSNTFCGSAAYAAPEILQGKPYDPKKYDIWALGCILYIMVMGQMPFDDSNILEMVEDQLYGNIRNFNFFCDRCSPNLRRLQMSLFETNMANRINTLQIIHHPWFLQEPYDVRMSNAVLRSMSDSRLI
ncbi:testis-specific serine/threonine-protein kinase 3-like [Diorhabda carinulata]|uniref:testis-specific serine/threonine-protein kinase 3-like n=1 Tax=Diorhabda carinulata TaxID=1163345 RepID=UPI0025A0BDAB|nr:testis-specific serine/threonine-protein kinase 3-like [Diorhabda carinulata]